MEIKAFIEKNENIKIYDCTYYLYPRLWKENKSRTIKLQSEIGWSNFIKYLNEKNKVSEEINQLPNDYGGIYVFYIQGDSIPFSEHYIAYVGRAQITQNENLRSRVKSYLSESKKQDGRVLICKLFKHWKKYLYVRYFKSKDNEFIMESESALIKAILPPFNTELTEYVIKQPQKAF